MSTSHFYLCVAGYVQLWREFFWWQPHRHRYRTNQPPRSLWETLNNSRRPAIFSNGPDQGVGCVLVDGRAFSSQGATSLSLSPGAHVIRSRDQRQTVIMRVSGGDIANIDVSEKGLNRK